ncbi:uncharacterized protein LOC127798108 [Diospyros lotus]|uniref:uncharacterized protein LOC127798108 n=1 Tax=Diospyros lotus TaxID=55363 RepID=UPI002251E8E0|nr:uncharacterized protein LOC127798108 [Diospyros lotus]
MLLLLHQRLLSLQPHPSSAPHASPLSKHRATPISTRRFGLMIGGGGNADDLRKRRGTDSHSRRAVERESEFEVDPDKARQALAKLDQQLQSLSQKQVNPPKRKASDLDQPPVQMREETPEFSVSFLAYSAFALLIFTIFYNLLFITVIKPSIDGS